MIGSQSRYSLGLEIFSEIVNRESGRRRFQLGAQGLAFSTSALFAY